MTWVRKDFELQWIHGFWPWWNEPFRFTPHPLVSASMGPRLLAVVEFQGIQFVLGVDGASMGPRLLAVVEFKTSPGPSDSPNCFNGSTAFGRGGIGNGGSPRPASRGFNGSTAFGRGGMVGPANPDQVTTSGCLFANLFIPMLIIGCQRATEGITTLNHWAANLPGNSPHSWFAPPVIRNPIVAKIGYNFQHQFYLLKI